MKATFIGHASLQFHTNEGKVIYVDPFFPGDYTEPADFLLVTHGHSDHMGVDKVTVGANCSVIMPFDALIEGEYQQFERDGVKITAVQAYNDNHHKEACVGYVLEADGVKVYCAGDTSLTEDMEKKLPKMGLDYAFLPVDGIYNMGPKEAGYVAQRIRAKVVFPIHNDPKSTETGVFYPTNLEELICENKVILHPGESVQMQKKTQ